MVKIHVGTKAQRFWEFAAIGKHIVGTMSFVKDEIEKYDSHDGKGALALHSPASSITRVNLNTNSVTSIQRCDALHVHPVVLREREKNDKTRRAKPISFKGAFHVMISARKKTNSRKV